MELVDVGYARRAHGIGGEVVIRPQTDDPERWIPGASFTTDETPPRMLEVTALRPHHDDLLVRFAGIDDRDAAESLKGARFQIPADQRRSLRDGEYWPDDLIGCSVVDADGSALGTVTAVDFGAGQDRLVVATETGDVAMPLVSEIVTAVDLENRKIKAAPPAGLF